MSGHDCEQCFIRISRWPILVNWDNRFPHDESRAQERDLSRWAILRNQVALWMALIVRLALRVVTWYACVAQRGCKLLERANQDLLFVKVACYMRALRLS